MQRIILDCDIGTDDAVALYLLLLAEAEKKIKIEMIICTRGNTTLDNVCKNTIRILEMANRTDIPVYRGADGSILPTTVEDELFHGADGFGDLEHINEPNLKLIKDESPFEQMRQLITKYPREITFLCVGPLTNLAILQRMYHDVSKKIKEIFIMGGNHLGIGNVSAAAEFNFYTDPEAAHIVFTCSQCPITLLPWEPCLNSDITMKWRMTALTSKNGKTWDLIDRAERAIYVHIDRDCWLPCDAFLAAAFLHPEMIIKKQVKRFMDVELSGKLTRGQVVVDHTERKQPNVNVIEEIDYEFFKELILKSHAIF